MGSIIISSDNDTILDRCHCHNEYDENVDQCAKGIILRIY